MTVQFFYSSYIAYLAHPNAFSQPLPIVVCPIKVVDICCSCLDQLDRMHICKVSIAHSSEQTSTQWICRGFSAFARPHVFGMHHIHHPAHIMKRVLQVLVNVQVTLVSAKRVSKHDR